MENRIKYIENCKEKLYRLFIKCKICPRMCNIRRTINEHGFCGVGRYAVVSSFFPHYGEEECLRLYSGSGTIFFSGCNLKCVFCQNFDISHEVFGYKADKKHLAEIMLKLQNMNCNNINLVTPSHVIFQIIEALEIAFKNGLNIPIVYNTSSYDRKNVIKMLDGIIDIYMPDFKFYSKMMGKRYCNAPDYGYVARSSIKEMYKQVGDLIIKNGIAIRGILLRHLIMPNCIEESMKIIEWVYKNLGENTFINLMPQYYPTGLVRNSYSEINRQITIKEYRKVIEYAVSLGFKRIYGLSEKHLLKSGQKK